MKPNHQRNTESTSKHEDMRFTQLELIFNNVQNTWHQGAWWSNISPGALSSTCVANHYHWHFQLGMQFPTFMNSIAWTVLVCYRANQLLDWTLRQICSFGNQIRLLYLICSVYITLLHHSYSIVNFRPFPPVLHNPKTVFDIHNLIPSNLWYYMQSN